jgi:flagellin FlaB
MLQKLHKHEKGITGLETAIILIAFVVVAAVFAYTALSAGLFSTQKAQEAVYSGLEEAQSTVELKGNVIATAGSVGDNGTVKQISFVVASALRGEPIDFTQPSGNTTNATGLATGTANKVVINYIDEDQTVSNLYWTVTKLGSDSGDYLLSDGEKYQITVGGTDSGSAPGNLVNALNPDLTVNKTFSLVLITPAGAILTIERTTPAYIDTVMNLR